MTPYPFKIGDRVRGLDNRINAVVVELVGPYSVFLSDGYVTPVSMLELPKIVMPWEKEKLPWE